MRRLTARLTSFRIDDDVDREWDCAKRSTTTSLARDDGTV
jgi:hypothetical protein